MVNIFQFAPKELSQDAVICWLIAYADAQYMHSDPLMHQVGKAFVDSLFKISTKQKIDYNTVKIYKQWEGIDILAEIGDSHVFLIEDKVSAQIHGDQLERYLKATATEYKGKREVIPVFLKSQPIGSELSREVQQKGYTPLQLDQLLEFLNHAVSINQTNEILNAYNNYLNQRKNDFLSFKKLKPSEWRYDSFTGFYFALQNALSTIKVHDCSYVANPSGGFNCCTIEYPYIYDIEFLKNGSFAYYMQIEEGKLVYKMNWDSATEEGWNYDLVKILRQNWLDCCIEASKNSNVTVKRPDHWRIGNSMTVAVLGQNGDWIKCNPDGLINFDDTVAYIQQAVEVKRRGIDLLVKRIQAEVVRVV